MIFLSYAKLKRIFKMNNTLKLALITLLIWSNLVTANDSPAAPETNKNLASLIGIWDLSYDTYTTRIELIARHPEEDITLGSLFFNGSEESEQILCMTKEVIGIPENDLTINDDYICITNSAPFRTFLLPLEGAKENTIILGAFGFGDTQQNSMNAAIEAINNLQRPVSGTQRSQSTYDAQTKTLVVPAIRYQGKKYKVSLKHAEDFIFSIQELDSATENITPALFEAVSSDNVDILFIPYVNFQEDKFFIILKNTGDFKFQISDIFPHPLNIETLEYIQSL